MRVRCGLREMIGEVMEKNPGTVDDLDLLYLEVCRKIDNRVPTLSFEFVMQNRENFKIPSYESVTRERRRFFED